MNCPHHHKVFSAEPRSYRDLPIRLAEYGQVYRFEDSGAVSGLVRVRGMCMNDAHIYCTKEQIKDEFKAVMAMYQEAYGILGLDNFHVRLSKWDPEDPKGKEKFVDNPQAWRDSEQVLEEVLNELAIDYQVGLGEGAFYGPKIDIQFSTVTGREESVSTVQLDFAVPGRMGLKYVGSDGEEHTPFCIHRAPFSTHERMVAFLIEHFAGAFPTWLAPIQVQLLTVSEQYDDYANEIVARLRNQMVRAELAPSNDTLPKKIRQGATRKIPNLLIIGEREVADGTVTLRRYGHQQQQTFAMADFEHRLVDAIKLRLPEVDAD
jgi:threonyl-tRNA synthetase